MEDWALIRRLVADGVPQRQVARDLEIGRSTVERALASDRPPKYERPAVPTSFTPFEPLVRQLLIATSDMPATVIAERVGWTGSITWFRDNVRRLRPEHRPVDPSDRLTWLQVTRRSATCGSRRGRCRSRTAPRRSCRSW